MSALPPGPSAPALLQSLQLLRAPYRFLDACAARYGEVFTLTLTGFGKFVMVSAPEDVKRVFLAEPEIAVAGKARAMLEAIFGTQSIMVLDGADHSWQRRLLMPHFHRDNLAAGESAGIEAARRAIGSWPATGTFALYPRLEHLATDVIIERFLGMGDHERSAETRHLLLAFLRAAHTAPVFHLPGLIDRLNVGPWRRFRRLRRQLDAILYAEMASRGASGQDLFSVINRAGERRGSEMGDVERRDIVISVIVAGHETVAIALAWALELVLSHPEVERRTRAEIDQATAGGPLRQEHLGRLPYLDAVIMESMRLCPINPIIPRLVQAPVTIGGHLIPPGVHVAANSYGAHRRESAFPQAHRFEPERFLDVRPGPFTWIPFGGGARKCIGMAFAQHEMKAIMATLLSECRLRLEPARARRETSVGDMAAPKGGVRCSLEAHGESPTDGLRREAL